MKHMVIILAGGIKRKWKSETHPIVFLAPIAGEPLIVRVIRQLSERDLVPVVATYIPEVARAAYPGLVLFLEGPTPRYVDTIMATDHLWADRGDVDKVTFLHGDMVWDEVALDFVLNSDGSPMFFGGVTGVVSAFGAKSEGFLELVHAAEVSRAEFASGFYYQFGGKGSTPSPYHSKLPSGFSADFDDFKRYQGWLSSRKWAR